MRIEFRERPDDLLLVGAASVALLSLVLSGVSGIVRFALAVLFIFVMPGYAIVAAVFPKDSEVPWLERIALSVGLSLATVALLGVVLDATPWGVRLDTIVVAVLVFNLGMCAFAYWRRM